jgi:acetyltransferase-like isoleucine patch superfamily enzyme
LEEHAFIGANSVVLPGVTVGQGAVVGAMSLVTRDVDPWTINVGSPSRTIGVRRRERIIEYAAALAEREPPDRAPA